MRPPPWTLGLVLGACVLGCLGDDYSGTLCNADGKCEGPGLSGYVCVERRCVRTDGGGAENDGGVDAGVRCPTNCTPSCCEDGTTAGRAARSCRAILTNGDGGQRSQPYWIDPDYDGPRAAVQLFCDMDGGWTLVGKLDGLHQLYDRWLQADHDLARLASPAIDHDGGYGFVDAVWMAVNSADEVRVSNSDLSRWLKWPMSSTRTVKSWWRHDAGFVAAVTSPHLEVTVTRQDGGVRTCYQNPYGLNPGGAHGGGFPSAYVQEPGGTIWGWSVAADDCVTVAVQKVDGSLNLDGFVHNGNGQDAPQNEFDWPNGTYNRPPHVAIWLR